MITVNKIIYNVCFDREFISVISKKSKYGDFELKPPYYVLKI